MKKTLIVLGCSAMLFMACNNQSADPVETAEDANETKLDRTAGPTDSQEESSEFLVSAAASGLAEVEAGKVGEQKATQSSVKEYAAMMVKDHSAANDEVKALAQQLNVTLPAGPKNEDQDRLNNVAKKEAKDFDKDFMDMMIKDHKKAIDLFKDASDDNVHPDVKSFINSTLPKLQAHLDAAESIRESLN